MKEKMVLVPVKDLKKVVEYLFEDEMKHWEEGNKPKKHIYVNLAKLESYL